MRASLAQLYWELDRSPEDWSVRIRLIEASVEEGEIEEAKRLVRESPDDRALPDELQKRIFALLTPKSQSASTVIPVDEREAPN